MSSLIDFKRKAAMHKILVHSTKEGSKNIDRISIIKIEDGVDGNSQNYNPDNRRASSSKQKQHPKAGKKEKRPMKKKGKQSIEPTIMTSFVLDSNPGIACSGSQRSSANKKAKTVNDCSLNVKAKEPDCTDTVPGPPKCSLAFVREVKQSEIENGPGCTIRKPPRSGVNKKGKKKNGSKLSVVYKEPSCSTTVPDSPASILDFVGEVKLHDIQVEPSSGATAPDPPTFAFGFVGEAKHPDNEDQIGCTKGKKTMSAVNKKAKKVEDSSLGVRVERPSCRTTVRDSSVSTLGFTRDHRQKNIEDGSICSTTVPDSLKCPLGLNDEVKQQSEECADENSMRNIEVKKNRESGNAKSTVGKSLPEDEDRKIKITRKAQAKKVEKKVTANWEQSEVVKAKRERLSLLRIPIVRRDSLKRKNVSEDLCVGTAGSSNMQAHKYKVKSDASVKIESENAGKIKKTRLKQAFQKSKEKIPKKVLKTEKLKVKDQTDVRRSKRLSLLPVISYGEY